jgi:hypothetical protein
MFYLEELEHRFETAGKQFDFLLFRKRAWFDSFICKKSAIWVFFLFLFLVSPFHGHFLLLEVVNLHEHALDLLFPKALEIYNVGVVVYLVRVLIADGVVEIPWHRWLQSKEKYFVLDHRYFDHVTRSAPGILRLIIVLKFVSVLLENDFSVNEYFRVFSWDNALESQQGLFTDWKRFETLEVVKHDQHFVEL